MSEPRQLRWRTRPRAARRWVVCVWVALAVVPAAWAAQTSEPFADCRRLLVEKPREYDSAYCFYTVVQRLRLWDEGRRVVERLVRQHPDNGFLSLTLGHILRERKPRDAEAVYRRAAGGFEAGRHAEGEFLTRSSLRSLFTQQGRFEEASAQLARIVQLGDSVDDPFLRAQVWTLQASHAIESGGNLGVAYRLLKQAERALFPAGPYRLKRTCLTWLGLVAFRLGRHDEALDLFTRLEALARSAGDTQSVANAQYNRLNTLSLKETLLPTPGARRRLIDLAEETLSTGLAVQYRQGILRTRRTLAALLAHEAGRRDEALKHLDECVAMAVSLEQPQDEAACSWLQALLLRATSPRLAHTAHLRALDATKRASNPVTDAFSAGRHMQYSWQSKPRREAVRDSLAALDALETLRRLQDDDESSAALFSLWTLDYYWLSGQLLQHGGDEDVGVAFSVTERMRARSLLDVVSRSSRRLDASDPSATNRRALLQQIALVQRALLGPTLATGERQARLRELEQLEHREQEAERQVVLKSRGQVAERPSFATLDDLQTALGPSEALLSYQVGIWDTYEGEFGGGSWLIVVTRDGRRVYRIPDRSHFAPIVPVFTGLLSGDRAEERVASARLYDSVFRGALKDLPPSVARLIIVADGPLQQLPFEALRPTADEAPIAVRYEVVAPPSATLWLQWQRAEPSDRTGRVLALADPALDDSSPRAASLREATLENGLRLGRLPHAQRETRAIARYVGAVESLVGPQASERALKTRDLQQYRLLHFAAHAVSDEAHPERSAVVLAAGADTEDGLLQAREIQELDLRGRAIVLSACQTASGAVLNGEGVLSLARAFFEAGARTVIGTRWPIRDADAAALFETFYRRVGEGASLSDALAATKVQAIEEGRATSAWASLVLLGEGTTIRLAPVRTSSSDSEWAPALVLAVSLALVMAIWAWVQVSRRARI